MRSRTVDLILIAIIVIAIYLLSRSCSNGSGETHTVLKIDTTVVTKTHIDTIPFVRDTVITYVNVTDTTYIEIEKPDGTLVRRFTYPISDSLIEGTIATEIRLDSCNPTLYSQSILYTPKFPKYIIKTDSVIVTIDKEKTVYTTPNKLLLTTGANFSQQHLGFNVGVGYRFKGNDITVNYDIINRAPGISLTFPISIKK